MGGDDRDGCGDVGPGLLLVRGADWAGKGDLEKVSKDALCRDDANWTYLYDSIGSWLYITNLSAIPPSRVEQILASGFCMNIPAFSGSWWPKIGCGGGRACGTEVGLHDKVIDVGMVVLLRVLLIPPEITVW